jgi:hypothetical protein
LIAERPFAGALAVYIPGATLPYCTVWCEQLCRLVWNIRPSGFTHYWGRCLKGYWIVKQKTAAERFSRAVRSIDSWCRDNRHISIKEQQQKLNEKLRCHYAYYGVTGNSGALSRFLREVERHWRQRLYRSNRNRSLNWTRFRRMLQRYPLARVRTARLSADTQQSHDSRNRLLECDYVRVCGSPGSAKTQGHPVRSVLPRPAMLSSRGHIETERELVNPIGFRPKGSRLTRG